MQPATAKKPKKTVLIVDDSAAIRHQVRDRFLSDGFTTCAEAANGKEALKVASECRPDIIILDFAMPVMNGMEAAPALRVIVPQAPIILFTLFADQLKAKNLTAVG